MDDLRFTTSSSVFQSYQEVGMAIVQGLIESVTESAVQKKLKKCNQFLPAGKLFCKFRTTTKRREIESRIVE